MNAPLFINILKETLLPVIKDVYPESHRFMQDNDPKYMSRLAREFYEDSHVNHWKTPPESPDLNPIENMWHEMKEFLRRKVNQQELIEQFWATVTVAKCTKYINHLKKVSSMVLPPDTRFPPPLVIMYRKKLQLFLYYNYIILINICY